MMSSGDRDGGGGDLSPEKAAARGKASRAGRLAANSPGSKSAAGHLSWLISKVSSMHCPATYAQSCRSKPASVSHDTMDPSNLCCFVCCRQKAKLDLSFPFSLTRRIWSFMLLCSRTYPGVSTAVWKMGCQNVEDRCGVHAEQPA